MNTSAHGELPEELMGISFGDLLPSVRSVYASLHSRVTDLLGRTHDTVSDPLLIGFAVLEELNAYFPGLFAAMQKRGADRLYVPFDEELPTLGWLKGPYICSHGPAVFYCAGFGYGGIIPAKGAILALVYTGEIGSTGEAPWKPYLVSYPVLRRMAHQFPQVLRQERARTTGVTCH